MKVHRCFWSIIFIDRLHIFILLSISDKKNINIQNFVCPPLASNTTLIRLGMLLMRFQRSSVGMLRTQDGLMVLISDKRLVGCFSTTLFFSSVKKFCQEILNWIEVRTISRPFQQFDIFRFENVRDDFCLMAWRPVVRKYFAIMHCHV